MGDLLKRGRRYSGNLLPHLEASFLAFIESSVKYFFIIRVVPYILTATENLALASLQGAFVWRFH